MSRSQQSELTTVIFLKGLTPLHLVLRQQKDSDVYDGAELLINAQAKVNTKDHSGQEPIQYAYRNTYVQMKKYSNFNRISFESILLLNK